MSDPTPFTTAGKELIDGCREGLDLLLAPEAQNDRPMREALRHALDVLILSGIVRIEIEARRNAKHR